MSYVVTSDTSTGLVVRGAQWFFFRLVGYFGVALFSGALFFAGATIYAYISPAESPAPVTKTKKPEIQPMPVRRPAPSARERVPMAQELSVVPVPNARVHLAGGNESLMAIDIYKKKVFDQENHYVGDVAGFLTGQDGKVEALIFTVGGILGVGEHNVAFPVDKVKVSKDPEWHLTVAADKGFLKSMPELKYELGIGWILEKTFPNSEQDAPQIKVRP